MSASLLVHSAAWISDESRPHTFQDPMSVNACGVCFHCGLALSEFVLRCSLQASGGAVVAEEISAVVIQVILVRVIHPILCSQGAS